MAADLDRFDWTLVRSFLAVLDAGSLMGAARRTGAQQPTLSRHSAELEAQLGAPLFERTGRGVSPTAAALAIVDAARQMQQGADALARTLAGQRNLATGTVRITTSMVAATYLLPPLIARLHAQEPGIQIELIASNQITNLLRRDADIAVRMVRPEQTSLVARKLGSVGIGAYAHESYLRRAGTPSEPRELTDHTLIGYAKEDVLVRGFAALGMPLAREAFSLRTDDQVAYGRLVAEGAGIGFVAHYNTRHWPGVHRILPMLGIPPLPCWLAVHREIRSNEVVRRVYDFLGEALPAALEAVESR
jgi:DNA-binding transcriptional LysR family regulator